MATKFNPSAIPALEGALKNIVSHQSSLSIEAKDRLRDMLTDTMSNMNLAIDPTIIQESRNVLYSNKFVSDIQKYDVISLIVGSKGHFCVVVGIKDDIVFSLPITHAAETNGIKNIKIQHSRMFNEGYFVPKIEICTQEFALGTFKFIYDGNEELDEIVKDVVGAYSQIINELN